MKEIVRASLSGISFVFDKEAYEKLQAYFDKLETGYKGDPDGREIIADIEARITEIILAKQAPEAIISEEFITPVIAQMGFPEGIEDKKSEEPPLNEFPRRLYRNPENSKLAGVCSGLGTFFDLDPVWIRVGFFAPLILVILTGPLHWKLLSSFLGVMIAVFFLLYFLLWFAIPLAKSPRQKLEMRGQKINASTIQRNFQEEFAGENPKTQKSASVVAQLVSVFGQIILFFVKFIGIIIGIALALAAAGILVAMICALVGVGTVFGVGLGALLPIGVVPAGLFVALVLLVILLPMIAVVYAIFRAIISSPVNRKFISGVLGIWLLIAIFTWVIGARNYERIRENIMMIEHYEYDLEDRLDAIFDDDYRSNERWERRENRRYRRGSRPEKPVVIPADTLPQATADSLTLEIITEDGNNQH